jgi:DNA polymerase III subunit epsilon
VIPLNCPLIVIDVETTGHHRKVDRIVQIGLIKIYPDGDRNEWQSYVHPTIPIPPEATKIHGITDEMVKDAPTFANLAPSLAAGFKGCDFGGYNVQFDLGFLEEEFRRVNRPGVINGRVVDAFAIYRRYHPRTLSDAVEEYLGRKMVGAHDAMVDARETLAVLEAQMARHFNDLPDSVHGIHTLLFESADNGYVDPDGKLYWRYGEACLNFGEHAGTPLRLVGRDYLGWVLRKDFPEPFKKLVREALEGRYPRRKDAA